jgi:hypothetical protein
MRKRLLLMGVLALCAMVTLAGPAGAVTDQNTTDLGQMPPFADSIYSFVHMNAMQQDLSAYPAGPRERTVTGHRRVGHQAARAANARQLRHSQRACPRPIQWPGAR